MRTFLFSLIFLIPFIGNAQIQNGNFSEWPEGLITSGHESELLNLGVLNPRQGTPGNWESSVLGVCRIDNGCDGGYGIILYSWYHGDPAQLTQTFSVNSNPSTLTGCYKSILLDVADTTLNRYVKITAFQDEEEIGAGLFIFESSDSYKDFEVPINYNSEKTASSITVEFHSDVFGSGNFPADGMIFLDGIALNFPTATQEVSPLPTPTFNIYPNPLTSSLFIDCTTVGNYHFEIFDLKGQLIKQGNLPNASNQLNISNFPEGLYIFNITDDNSQRLVGKFLKIYSR